MGLCGATLALGLLLLLTLKALAAQTADTCPGETDRSLPVSGSRQCHPLSLHSAGGPTSTRVLPKMLRCPA